MQDFARCLSDGKVENWKLFCCCKSMSKQLASLFSYPSPILMLLFYPIRNCIDKKFATPRIGSYTASHKCHSIASRRPQVWRGVPQPRVVGVIITGAWVPNTDDCILFLSRFEQVLCVRVCGSVYVQCYSRRKYVVCPW